MSNQGQAPQRQLAVEPMSTATRRDVPLIRLKGNWLRKAGFNVGTRVRITETTSGGLRVEVIQPESTDRS